MLYPLSYEGSRAFLSLASTSSCLTPRPAGRFESMAETARGRSTPDQQAGSTARGRRVVSWVEIVRLEEESADIGPQVEEELRRMGGPPFGGSRVVGPRHAD